MVPESFSTTTLLDRTVETINHQVEELLDRRISMDEFSVRLHSILMVAGDDLTQAILDTSSDAE